MCVIKLVSKTGKLFKRLQHVLNLVILYSYTKVVTRGRNDHRLQEKPLNSIAFEIAA